MTLKSLDYYAALADDLYDNPDNEDRRKKWNAIDNMDKCAVEIPSAIKELEWVGNDAKFADTLPHDIIQAVVRFLATRLGKIKSIPIHPDPSQLQVMDAIETVLGWNYRQLNRQGTYPPFLANAYNLIKYSATAFQVVYNPYEVERKNGKEFMYSTSERRRMLRGGAFSWLVENPQNIFPVNSGNTLKAVVKVGVCTLQDLIDEYGEDNKAVAKAIKKMTKDSEVSDYRATYVSKTHYMDDYCRADWFTVNGTSQTYETGAEERYELLRKEHKLDFLPWVVVDYKHPLLEGIVDAGLYDHLATLDAIIMSKAVAVAADKDRWISTPNPNDPNLPNGSDNPAGAEIVQTGTTINSLQPRTVDANLFTLRNMLRQQLVESAAARALIAIESFIGGNTPASSINAAQSTALAQLGLVQSALERCEAEGLYKGLEWMWATDKGMVGYKTQQGGDTPMTAAGAQFYLGSSKDRSPSKETPPNAIYLDPQNVYIEVHLQPVMIQDEQAKFNLALIKQQAGVPRSMALEEAGVDNPDLAAAEIARETWEMSLIKSKAMEIEGQAQAKVQAMMAQVQMQVQMAMQQQQGAAPPQGQEQQTRDMNAAGQFGVTQGTDSRFGGQAPSQVVQGENRNTLNGEDDMGRTLA